jgi:hypothetical protein
VSARRSGERGTVRGDPSAFERGRGDRRQRLDAAVRDPDPDDREPIAHDTHARRRREHLVAEAEHDGPRLADDDDDRRGRGRYYRSHRDDHDHHGKRHHRHHRHGDWCPPQHYRPRVARRPVYYEYDPPPAYYYGQPPRHSRYYCEPCDHWYGTEVSFHYHVRHHHGIAAALLPAVIVGTVFGAIFAGY